MNRIFHLGQRVRFIWHIKNDLTPVYMEGEIVGIYGPEENPVTIDTISNIGRTAHRPWQLELL